MGSLPWITCDGRVTDELHELGRRRTSARPLALLGTRRYMGFKLEAEQPADRQIAYRTLWSEMLGPKRL